MDENCSVKNQNASERPLSECGGQRQADQEGPNNQL